MTRKLGLEQELCTKIVERVCHIGKGDSALAYLHELLALGQSLLEKVNTEAARLGVIKRKIVAPEATIFSSATEMAEFVQRVFLVSA